ncbi:tctex1 domain-containing protein 2-like [Pomacea canaliculata]|uniref:tctex1 domain-containing protein 2-like n=1 Tax=Pomacea canaliculata TaxID=400727 RepID=UPI000D735ABE|nr:tctex1 domain-containing protein 2-like [Pomacea canaliculata]XP_025110767.1 tctex1 domain-containing protein 2-like [Pomacea canaliculata]
MEDKETKHLHHTFVDSDVTYCEPEDERLVMHSLFDWIERPLAAMTMNPSDYVTRQRSFFEAPPKQVEPFGTAVTSFACEPPLEPSSKRAVAKYENTYRMDPPVEFKPDMVEPLMNKILTTRLKGKDYDSIESPALCKVLADEIKQGVKKFNFKRYKLISEVMIGQMKQQGFIKASRFLWDSSRDNFASVSYKNRTLFAVAVLYALNFE